MGSTIRRQPVNFKIPSSPDYKFFNVTDFRGLEMTDNPFTANSNTASDLLNVYVDENNALTTRPRLEKQYEIGKNIPKFNRVLYSYKLMDKIIFQVLINSTIVRLYYKQGDNLVLIDNDTNNIALPETKLAIFEKKDKIYVMTGTLYCVIKSDNIMYFVRDDEDTYVPTTGISTINDNGIRVMADYEQKNILSNKYKIQYFWDLESDLSDIIGSDATNIDNGYITKSQIAYPDYKIDSISMLLDNGDLLLNDSGKITIIRDSGVLNSFEILSGKILTISKNGKWFLCLKDNNILFVDDTDTVKGTYVLPENKTVSTSQHTAYIDNTGSSAFIIQASSFVGDVSDWNFVKLELSDNHVTSTEILSNKQSDVFSNNLIIKYEPNMTKLVLMNIQWDPTEFRFCIVSNPNSKEITSQWFSWNAISALTGWYPTDPIDWYNIVNFNNDCSFVIGCHYKNIVYGYIDYELKTISSYSDSLSFLGDDDDIAALRTSGDLIYILAYSPFFYHSYRTHKCLIGNVYAYSIDSKKSYELYKLEPVDIDNSTYKYHIRDSILGWSYKSNKLYLARLYSSINEPTIYDGVNSYIVNYSVTASTEPKLIVTYTESKFDNSEFQQQLQNVVLTENEKQIDIDLSFLNNISSITLSLENIGSPRIIKYENVYGHYSFYSSPTSDTTYMVDVKWFEDTLSIKASEGWVLEGLTNRIYNENIKISIQYKKPVIESEQTFDFNGILRFQNNFWFYGNGNEIRWTGNNDPTYFPEYSYTNLGDTNDFVNDMLMVSYDTAIAFKQNNMYVITPTEISDGRYTFTFVEAKTDIGVIAPQSSIISPLTETPLYVNARGIYGIRQLKNIQSTDRISVLYSENVNKKYLNEDKKSHIQTISRLYWVLFIIPGKITKIYVFDDRTSSWYYWEIPINVVGCWSDDLNSYFVSDDGKVYVLKTNDIIDTTYSPETEYYDDGRKLIPWYWKSQILSLGTINYSKKLINTTFILTDTDENEEYGLNYKFKAYRKIVSETNATTISNRLNYIQSTTKKTTIPRFNFLQMELSNVEEDLNNNKLRLVGLGLKYELLEGLS